MAYFHLKAKNKETYELPNIHDKKEKARKIEKKKL